MLAATLTSSQIHKKFKQSFSTLQCSLDKIYDWLKKRKLHLHPSKS